MRRILSLVAILSIVPLRQVKAAESIYERELDQITQSTIQDIEKAGRTKVSVLDFTDLEGNTNELGRFLAESFSDSLVIGRKGFSVLDRANLKSVLQEHKLTASGLVNPENAKKLGQFAGVDAIIIGVITPLQNGVVVSVKVITTDTAEIVSAHHCTITRTSEIQQLLDHGIVASSSETQTRDDGGAPQKEFTISNPVQKFNNFEVELLSFQVRPNDTGFAALQIRNTTKQITVGVGVNSYCDPANLYHSVGSSRITDENGTDLRAETIEGINILPAMPNNSPPTGFGAIQFRIHVERNWHWVNTMTQIRPGDTLRFTIEFAVPKDINRREDWQAAKPPTKLGHIFKLQTELITFERRGDDDRTAPFPKLDNIYLDNIFISRTTHTPSEN